MAASSGETRPDRIRQTAVTICAVGIVELLLVGVVGIATVDNRHHSVARHAVVSVAPPAPPAGPGA